MPVTILRTSIRSSRLSYNVLRLLNNMSSQETDAKPSMSESVSLHWSVGYPKLNEPSVGTSISAHDDETVKVSLRPLLKEVNAQKPKTPNCQSEIPQSVLQYERQMRKFQHAQKVGKPVKDLKVVYVDDHLCVVSKPPGVLTVPGVHSRASLLDKVHEVYGSNCEQPIHMVVHRLDMDTSGLVVFGRTLEITKKLQELFRNRQTQKRYQALVVGQLPFAKIDIDLALQKDHQHPPFMRVATPQSEKDAKEAVQDLQRHGWKKLVARASKPSQTRIRVLEIQGDDSLPSTRVELEPVTGRTHQLRVHMASLGFPIIGDATYGLYGEAALQGGLVQVPVSSDPTSSPIQIPSLSTLQRWTQAYVPNEQPMCLHACKLGMVHPMTKEWMEWELPPDF